MTNLGVAEKKSLMAQEKDRLGETKHVPHSDPDGVQTRVVKKRKNVEGTMVKSIPIATQTTNWTSKSPS